MPVGSDPRQEALVQATLSAQADATRNALEQAFKAEQIASQRQVTARAASEPAAERGAGQPVERTLPASGQVVRETPTPTPTALSVACNRAVPSVAWTVLFAIVAAMVCLTVLDVPTPAPANAPVTPVLPLLPAAAPEPPAARA